jgi:hypothetical protein
MEKQYIKGGRFRRELISNIRKRINAGKDRQDIFNDLTSQFYEQDVIATLIAGIPNPSDVQEMRKKSLFVFGALFIYAILHIISIFINMSPLIASDSNLIFALPMMFIWPAVAIWTAFQVKQNRGSFYRFSGWICIVLVLNNLRGLFYESPPDNIVSWTLSIVLVLILLVSSFISFKIKKKYFPHLAYFGVRKENGKYILGR